jgi:ComF family protein
MRPVSGMVCSVCGERILTPYALSSALGEALCALCRRIEPPFAKAAAYGSYSGGLRDLVHLLKYERVRPAAKVLGRMLEEAIGDMEHLFGTAKVVMVPVPLDASKRRQRGFNQSELIAQAALKLRPTELMRLEPQALRRCRATESQIGLTRHQRRENMRGAFAVVRAELIKGKDVLLVDDVFTTGTTVSECARVLRRAGASRVFVATVARTLKANAESVELPEFSDQTMAAAG